MALVGLWLHCPCHTLRTKLPCHLLNIRQQFQSPGLVEKKRKKKNKAQKAELAHYLSYQILGRIRPYSYSIQGLQHNAWHKTTNSSLAKHSFGRGKRGASQKWSMLRASATQTHFIVYTTPRSSCNKLTRFFVFTDCLVKEPQIHSNPGKQLRQSQPRGRNL